MNGLVYLLDQAGSSLAQLAQENEQLKKLVEAMKKEIAELKQKDQ